MFLLFVILLFLHYFKDIIYRKDIELNEIRTRVVRLEG